MNLTTNSVAVAPVAKPQFPMFTGLTDPRSHGFTPWFDSSTVLIKTHDFCHADVGTFVGMVALYLHHGCADGKPTPARARAYWRRMDHARWETMLGGGNAPALPNDPAAYASLRTRAVELASRWLGMTVDVTAAPPAPPAPPDATAAPPAPPAPPDATAAPPAPPAALPAVPDAALVVDGGTVVTVPNPPVTPRRVRRGKS